MRYLVLIFLVFQKPIFSQNFGCTDSKATNFNPNANKNDGSCVYPNTVISQFQSFDLNDSINETSGLIFYNNSFWTHNDDTDKKIYSINSEGKIITNLEIKNSFNKDWEEISQDETHLYIGDFGNNSNGNRTDLRIYKILKSSLFTQNQIVDTIFFSYSTQTDFTATSSNKTNFDCESMIVSKDSIYLFTKQWLNFNTSVFSIPKTKGNHTAKFKEEFNINGLVTGAFYNQDKRLIVLCGYSSNLSTPFIYLLYDFNENLFFSGNKRKINLSLFAHQIEAITSINSKQFYLTNESYNNQIIQIKSQLHQADLSEYLNHYLSNIETFTKTTTPIIFPNPILDNEFLNIDNCQEYNIKLIDCKGSIIHKEQSKNINLQIDISQLSNGVYTILLNKNGIVLSEKIIVFH